jgi:hypothetical protein
VRRDHPFWQAIVNLEHGRRKMTRLMLAARKGDLARVREMRDWRADVEASGAGVTALYHACREGKADCALELMAHGASVEAARDSAGASCLIAASERGHVEVVRALLAAGADKRRINADGDNARTVAGTAYGAPQGSRPAIRALLRNDDDDDDDDGDDDDNFDEDEGMPSGFSGCNGY